MDLLPVTLIIGLLAFTSTTCLHKSNFLLLCTSNSSSGSQYKLCLQIKWKFQICEISKIKNSWQCKLNCILSTWTPQVTSMDISLNPRPPTPPCSPDSPDNDPQHSSYFYSTAALLSLNPYKQEPKLAHLPSNVWNNIRTLKLNRFPATHRRKSGGRRKPGTVHHHIKQTTTTWSLPLLFWQHPEGSPCIKTHWPTKRTKWKKNLKKTPPKSNSNIMSGTKVCLWNTRSTRNKHFDLTDYIYTNKVIWLLLKGGLMVFLTL